MEPLSWGTVAQLIVSIGMPAVEKLISLWESKSAVTLAEFQSLRTQAQQTAKDRMTAMLNAAGIALDDPKAVALLALVAA